MLGIRNFAITDAVVWNSASERSLCVHVFANYFLQEAIDIQYLFELL